MSTKVTAAKLRLWRDERANERELHWECLVPAEWIERPESVRPALGDVLLARFNDALADIHAELSASYIDREVAASAWLAILAEERNEQVAADTTAPYEPNRGILSTEYTSAGSLFCRTSRIVRNGPWMLFATVTAPAQVHAEVARDTAAMLLSFHPLNPSGTAPEMLISHSIDGPSSLTFKAPASWTTLGGETELEDQATPSRSLALREGDASLAILRVRVFTPGTTTPQRALAQQLAPMRSAGTTFEGSPIVPLGGDERWSDRFFAELDGRFDDTPLTGYFHFLTSDLGDVAIWTLSFSRDANPVVWAMTKRAGEIAAGTTSSSAQRGVVGVP